MLRTAMLFAFILIAPSLALADERYTVKKVGEGAFVVTDSTRTDGKSQTSNIFTTEKSAQKEADKQNKDQKKLDKKLEKDGIK